MIASCLYRLFLVNNGGFPCGLVDRTVFSFVGTSTCTTKGTLYYRCLLKLDLVSFLIYQNVESNSIQNRRSSEELSCASVLSILVPPTIFSQFVCRARPIAPGSCYDRTVSCCSWESESSRTT